MEPFSVIIPDEASLTAPIAASTELSKLYMIAAKQIEQMHAEIWIEEIRNDEDVVIRRVTHYPKDYKWFLEYCRKIAADISHINAHVEGKNIENKIKMVDIFMQSEAIPRQVKEDFVASTIRNRVIENEH
jgi:hypothetical protein